MPVLKGSVQEFILLSSAVAVIEDEAAEGKNAGVGLLGIWGSRGFRFCVETLGLGGCWVCAEVREFRGVGHLLGP
jgi:hypothetical protein